MTTKRKSLAGIAPGSSASVQMIEIDRSIPLTGTEQDELTRFEGLIASRLKAFLEVGAALLEIKRRHLYRERFSNFEDYCRSKLSPMGDVPLPANERQFRTLTALPVKTAEKVWRSVLARAGTPGNVTAALVKTVILEITGKAKAAPASKREDWQMRVEPLLERPLNSSEKETEKRSHLQWNGSLSCS
jgi:hypothetical protein